MEGMDMPIFTDDKQLSMQSEASQSAESAAGLTGYSDDCLGRDQGNSGVTTIIGPCT